jgi:hypothetical protein
VRLSVQICFFAAATEFGAVTARWRFPQAQRFLGMSASLNKKVRSYASIVPAFIANKFFAARAKFHRW